MRQGREQYAELYPKVMRLYNEGKTMKEIAEELGISYSAVYHWVTGIRKPDIGNIRAFEEFLRAEGPTNADGLKKKFPKHNEIFLTAKRRGLDVRRYVTGAPRLLKDKATWYYLKGQEEELKKRILGMLRGK